MTAKIEPHVKLLAANIIQKLMPIEGGNEHVFYELCGIIAAHAPKEKAAWEAKEKALRELATKFEIASPYWGNAISNEIRRILNTPAAGGKEQPCIQSIKKTCKNI